MANSIDILNDAVTTKCVDYKTQISGLQTNIIYFTNIKNLEQAGILQTRLDALKKEYDNLKCAEKVDNEKTKEVNSFLGSYSEMDKTRIEAETKYKTKQRIFFGAIFFFGALMMIAIFKKK
jgi:hypothetical protein